MIKLNSRFEKLKKPNVPTINEIKEKYGLSSFIKLNYNESNYGPSPKILKYNFSLSSPHIYPEYGSKKIVNYLSSLYGLKFCNFLMANGSDILLDSIPALFSSNANNDNIIIPNLTFGRIEQTCIVHGINTIKIPLNNGYIDLDATFDAINDKTRVIYIVNPNMPTGKLITNKKILEFMDKLPKNILVVLDEAYIEYSYGILQSFKNAAQIIGKYDNVIITRTFSKLFALAGYRIGYLISNKRIVDLFKKSLNIYPITNISSEYAYMALNEIEYYENVIKKINEEKNKYYSFLNENNISFYSSSANFIYIDTQNQKWNNSDLYDFLIKKKKILVRKILNIGIRITIGLPEENKKLFIAFKEFLNGKKI